MTNDTPAVPSQRQVKVQHVGSTQPQELKFPFVCPHCQRASEANVIVNASVFVPEPVSRIVVPTLAITPR